MFEIGTLDQLAIIIMGQSPKGSSVNAFGEIPLLNGPTEFGLHHPTPVQFTSDPKRIAQKGDLLFCVRGSTGKMNWADKDYAIGRGLAAIRPKDGYSKYFLKGSIEFFLKELVSGATGTVFTNVNKNQLYKMKCFIPDKESLKNINNILKYLSEIIELNQEMDRLLNKILETLFKSWFIKFDPLKAKYDNKSASLSNEFTDLFPNDIVETNLGNLPRGWSYANLGDIFSIEYGKNLPVQNLLDDGYPVFGGNGIIGFNSKYLYDDEMTIIACRGAASGKVSRSLPKSFITNNSLIINHTKSKIRCQRYIELFLKGKSLKNYVTGSAQPQLTIENIKNLKFLIPSAEVLSAFEKKCNLISQQQLILLDERTTIKKLKDILLPKIISGQFKIPRINHKINEVDI